MPHPLEQALDYRFADAALLRAALTHRSHGSPHNERLEFLGDSILDAVIARQLYERFPRASEGSMTRLRANLVCQDSLRKLALTLSLGEHIQLGGGELKSDGCNRSSILADALEAVFGAVWLDGGFDGANRVIVRLYDDLLAGLVPEKPLKDAKSRLQEYLQGRRLPLPKYVLAGADGEAHTQWFTFVCKIGCLHIETEGQGVSRRAAEQAAAEKALEQLQANG
ncbi:MAG: ribonuclease III [Candidatus Accumulibacter sp.]|jgi:ribonuclease-3|nr:ribonuclease III [Accumulibacter sp.]